MIDLDYAIKEFNNYVSNYNLKDSKIKLKYKHTLRVMELSIEIAKSLNLSEEDIKLAGLIGLLHDIGRFDQAAKYNSFNDHKTINHGEYGANILFKEDLIRKFIIDDTYDEIIKKSVYAHNRDEIPESYNEHEMLHARIIRDADKLDIFYLLSSKEIYFKGTNDKVSEVVLNKIYDYKHLKLKELKYRLDGLLYDLALIYDLNFDYSFIYVRDKNFITMIINNAKIKTEKTSEIFKDVETKLKSYVNKRIGDTNVR